MEVLRKQVDAVRLLWSHQIATLSVVAALAVLASTASGRAAGLPTLPSDGTVCQTAIRAAEQSARLPEQLLGAVGLVESGRIDPKSGRAVPWPWTIDVAGTGRFFETKAAAIAAVELAQAEGAQSIDVGCMQINLAYHPNAFASLDQAFDPTLSTRYAASFLKQLYAQTGDWSAAAAAYHSQTPGVSDSYVRRVVASWPLGGRYIDPMRMAALSLQPAAVRVAGLHDKGPACVKLGLSNYTPQFLQMLTDAEADRVRLLGGTRLAQSAMLPQPCGLRAALRAASLHSASATRRGRKTVDSS
jgi:hypothetical protein